MDTEDENEFTYWNLSDSISYSRCYIFNETQREEKLMKESQEAMELFYQLALILVAMGWFLRIYLKCLDWVAKGNLDFPSFDDGNYMDQGNSLMSTAQTPSEKEKLQNLEQKMLDCKKVENLKLKVK